MMRDTSETDVSGGEDAMEVTNEGVRRFWTLDGGARSEEAGPDGGKVWGRERDVRAGRPQP